jgi:hypothetical protein
MRRPLAVVIPLTSSSSKHAGRDVGLARMARGDLGPSGGRYVHIDHDVEPSPRAFDADREERLWSVVYRLVGRPASGKPRDPADAVTDDDSGTRSTTPHEQTG